MDRREIYKLVADLLPCVGGAAALLDRAAAVMRGKSDPDLADLAPILEHDDALGQIYQAINAPALEAAYRGTARERRKFKPGEIPAVTQLFTPRWVVQFLLQNTLGKLWLLSHPHSNLRSQWKWIAGNIAHPATHQHVSRASDIRICDPACGTMNFGLIAIDMLRAMYREEHSTRDLADIDTSIVRNNLVGFDIDPAAIDLARRSLEVKMRRTIRNGDAQLFVRDALFDATEVAPFDVVVTNPPYLSARNLDPSIVRRLKKRFPAAWRDLYACFILRAIEMLRPGGRTGILAMHSFMFTGAFERMRRELQAQASVDVAAHFGPGLFDIGNPGTLQTAAIVLQKNNGERLPATFFRQVNVEDKRRALMSLILLQPSPRPSPGVPGEGEKEQIRFEVSQIDLASSPRGAWMYWVSPAVTRAFAQLPKLGEIAPPRQGLATTDNARFVRYWWEVEPPGYSGQRTKWMPYAKGGRFRRWYEAARHRVNWENDGADIKAAIVERYPYLNGQWQWVAKNSSWYGREGITYSYLTSGSFSARKLESGTIFDVAGSSLFPDDPLAMLGVLNSNAATEFLAAINPTVNFQVGDLRQLPIPRSFPNELRQEVSRAIESTRRLDSFDETSPDFLRPEDWNGRESDGLRETIKRSQKEIDHIVDELYGMDPRRTPASMRAGSSDARAELARRWISYALGIWLGRWGNQRHGDVAAIVPLDPALQRRVLEILKQEAGESPATQIIAEVRGLERFFLREFLPWHGRIYRDRPVFWGFSDGERLVAVSSLDTDTRSVRNALRLVGATLPAGWRCWTDDGIRINLAPLREWIAERRLRQSLSEVETDLRDGKLLFSETAKWMAKISRGSTISQGSTGGCDPVPPGRRRRKLAASAGP